jgi:hypothetical protein
MSDTEFFPTPFGLVEGCIDAMLSVHNTPRMVLDAGAGTGHWGLVLKSKLQSSQIFGIDSHFSCPSDSWYDNWWDADYFGASSLGAYIYNWVIGNPPFKQVLPWVQRSLELIDQHGVVGLLVPLGFLAAAKYNLVVRGEFAVNKIFFIQPRPSFTGNGVTAVRTDYAFCVWRKPGYAVQPHGFINWDRGRNVYWEAKFNAQGN